MQILTLPPKMRIAVNVRLLLKNRLEGIGWFTYENLKRITTQHPEHEFIFIFDRKYDNEFIFSPNVTPIIINPPTRHPILLIIWFELQIPQLLKKHNVDLFLSPDGFMSLRTNIPTISVIHDINFAHRPKDLPYKFRKYYNYFFPRFAKKATRIATVSEYSKTDIAKTYDISKSKIDVVYNGSNKLYKPISEQEKTNTQKKYSEGNPYFIFIGAFSPRKNIKNLILAFNQFKNTVQSNFNLILIGSTLFKDKELEATYENLQFKENIIFVGRQDPENLHKLLASAHALTFVPFFEGFGIPIVEAIECNVPVICSNTTSMPEVAGDAAYLVDPSNINDISLAMNKLAFDNTIRKNLINNTIKRSGYFSWDKSAKLLWSTIETVLKDISTKE